MSDTRKPTEIRSKDDIVNRNVAVYMNIPSMPLVIELHASVIRDLLSRGNRVTAYVCDKSFKSPMDNPFNRALVNGYRMFRARDAVKGLDVRMKIVNLRGVTDQVPERTAEILGIGTMSSFASLLKAQSKEELPPRWLRAYNNMFSSARKLYNYFIAEVRKEGYDFIFLYNGRLGCARPALEAARDSNIGFALYETRILNEVVFVNELVHSIEGNARKAQAFYDLDPEAAEKRAEEYFIKKTQNQYTGEVMFTKMQEQGSLPDGVRDTKKKVIAVYTTNDDEYKFIGKSWGGFIPQSQVDEIDKLAKALPEEEYLIVVKMHPSQVRTAGNIIEKYVALAGKHKHVIVEEPLSKKDTYALMRRADVVVTFASTVGIEATYARKPLILIGDTTWGNLNIANKVYSGDEAAALIKSGVETKPILGAIVYGNYLSAQRDRLPAFTLIKRGDYLVDGRRIGASTLWKLLQLPSKLEMYVSKPGFFSRKQFIQKMFTTLGQIVKGR